MKHLALKNLPDRIFLRYYRYASNSFRLFESPVGLAKAINCEWLSRSNLAINKEVFMKYKFDETLKAYPLIKS